MTPSEREALIEAATTAHRGREPGGHLLPSPAWCDLDAGGRLEAFAATFLSRALEAALDADGLSTTARAVLAQLRRVEP
jgi:hypothetical protein